MLLVPSRRSQTARMELRGPAYVEEMDRTSQYTPVSAHARPARPYKV
jgi:hypothetical protein